MPTVTISAKNIRYIKGQFLEAIKDACIEFMGEMEKDLTSATSTWNEPPVFNITREPLRMTTTSNKYKWVNDGTRERWAKMSPDWKSKSTPGSLKASAGHGHVIARGRRQMSKPQPGIEARHFDETSAIKNARKFKSMLRRAVTARRSRIFY